MKIFLLGYMASGKSTFGKWLSEKLEVPFFDLDALVEIKARMTVPEIFETFGESHFRVLEKSVLEDFIGSNRNFVLATGGGTPCFFTNLELMNRSGITVYLNAPISMLAERIIFSKDTRPLVRNIAENDLEKFIRDHLNQRKQYYENAKIQFVLPQTSRDEMKETIMRYFLNEN